MTDLVRTDTAEGVLTITLARADKKNALTPPMYQAMKQALDSAATDADVRVVLIQGEGEDFCAGNDVTDFARFAATPGPRPQDALQFVKVIAAFEKPVVAAVEGFAVGIGVTMLMHCDLVYVAEDARMSTPFSKLGLTPEAGSSLLLTAQVGQRRAFAMFGLGEPIDGRTAAAFGIANEALPPGQVKARALQAARTLASRSPEALRTTKALMRDREATLKQIDLEMEEFEERMRSPQAVAAFKAFMEKGG